MNEQSESFKYGLEVELSEKNKATFTYLNKDEISKAEVILLSSILGVAVTNPIYAYLAITMFKTCTCEIDLNKIAENAKHLEFDEQIITALEEFVLTHSKNNFRELIEYESKYIDNSSKKPSH